MRKFSIEGAVFRALHEAVADKFRKQHPGFSAPDYQLYGYNQEQEDKASIRKAILRKYEEAGQPLPAELERSGGGASYNGKYLRDALKVKLEKSKSSIIDISEAYLQTYLFYLDTDLEGFLEYASREGLASPAAVAAQHRLLGKAAAPYKAPIHEVGLRCYYYSRSAHATESFVLELKGNNARIREAPSGKSYEGVIDQYKKATYNQSVTLVSNKNENVKAEVHLVFSGRAPLCERWFSTGYIAMLSDVEFFSGALIAENDCADQALERAAEAWGSRPVSLDGPEVEQFLGQVASAAEELAKSKGLPLPARPSLYTREMAQALRNDWPQARIQPEALAGWLREAKQREYTAYLEEKKVKTRHAPLNSYGAFREALLRRDPAYQATAQMKAAIAGNYLMLTTFREGEEALGMEQMAVSLRQDGRFTCRTADEGVFQGVYQIQQQRILEVQLKKVDGPSNYFLVLEVPKDIKHADEGSRVLYGIAGGLSKDMKPRADKVLLCRQTGREGARPAFYPAGAYQPVVEQLKNQAPDIQRFFSLTAKDHYLQGSNILFSYLINLPVPQGLGEIQGAYEYYRLNIGGDTLKKCPFEIREKGAVALFRDGLQAKGRAVRYGRRVFLFFYGNGPQGIEGCLAMRVLDKEGQCTEGLLTSFSDADEPFGDTLLIRRLGSEAQSPYRSLRLNSPQLREGAAGAPGAAVLARDLLLGKPNFLFLPEEELEQVRDLQERPAPDWLKGRLRQRYCQELVLAMLGQRPGQLKQAAARAIAQSGLDAEALASAIQEYYPQLSGAQTGLIREQLQAAGEAAEHYPGGPAGYRMRP